MLALASDHDPAEQHRLVRALQSLQHDVADAVTVLVLDDEMDRVVGLERRQVLLGRPLLDVVTVVGRRFDLPDERNVVGTRRPESDAVGTNHRLDGFALRRRLADHRIVPSAEDDVGEELLVVEAGERGHRGDHALRPPFGVRVGVDQPRDPFVVRPEVETRVVAAAEPIEHAHAVRLHLLLHARRELCRT